MHVQNVKNIELNLIVVVMMDMLKLMENVNLVHTTVKHVL